MSEFIPGLRLAELFYHEALEPILERHFPGLRYSAALLGTGSEVQGFDTERSTDHGWGPRALLFLAEGHVEEYAPRIDEVMRHELPYDFRGWSTSLVPAEEGGSLIFERITSGPIHHQVTVTSVQRFLHFRLGLRTYPDIDVLDWIVF